MSAEFPFLSISKTVSTSSLPMFRCYAWDFEKDCFERDGNGHMILLEGNDALKVWIIKALKTERFIYKAYSWRYGIELEPFIGKVLGVQERQSELKRMITEALMVVPYIRAISKIEFAEADLNRVLQINIELETVYGKLII